jgi:hypothetical protein
MFFLTSRIIHTVVADNETVDPLPTYNFDIISGNICID